ncbi:MAG: helix-turn-helix domain-containing protein [Alphaproteobacteria bacterium]|nr:helix-turn-helix domain-containing protein [Alphaproteobacteria bacterium]MDX5415717.1 helix-turn-helix domain-containing protein [Alphaproteobacteria bacterium]MDX5492979.1 helix-turn-helix domain-containing protein [Alphaproteobacteria bacterium]
MTPFGRRLRELRAARGITMKEMAAALRVTPAYLSALEHGKRGRPSWRLVQAIIGYFNVIWDEAEELERLARLSHPRIVIDTSGLAPQATEAANILAEDIAQMTPAEIETLLALLKGRKRRPHA